MIGNLNNLIANALENVVANLRNGNSNINASEADAITTAIYNLTNQNRELSTEEAIRHLNVSRNNFYNHIKPQLKGIKRPGQKTTLYTIKELDKFKNSLQHPKNKQFT